MEKACVISLGIHLAIFGAYRLGWVSTPGKTSLVARLLPTPSSRLDLKPQPPGKPIAPALHRETPMTFVEVDPALAPKEPPKETKYYSTDNSVAANPKPAKESEKPKIDGTQKNVVRTTDVPKPAPKPLEPTPPKETKPADPVVAKPKPKTGDTIGDLAKATPQKIKQPDPNADGSETEKLVEAVARKRPRTVAEAKQQQAMLAGKPLEQEGGVERARLQSSLDVKASPFGDYDRDFINAVQERWYQLLANNKFMLDRHGKVVLDFRLNYDGRITNVRTSENNVGDLLGLLCQKGVTDPSPFRCWPDEMRRMVGTDFREVRFTFYYD